MSKDNGGLAFPFNSASTIRFGMTMRQYYKAHALVGLITRYGVWNKFTEELAEDAGKIADAMIAEDKS